MLTATSLRQCCQIKHGRAACFDVHAVFCCIVLANHPPPPNPLPSHACSALQALQMASLRLAPGQAGGRGEAGAAGSKKVCATPAFGHIARQQAPRVDAMLLLEVHCMCSCAWIHRQHLCHAAGAGSQSGHQARHTWSRCQAGGAQRHGGAVHIYTRSAVAMHSRLSQRVTA